MGFTRQQNKANSSSFQYLRPCRFTYLLYSLDHNSKFIFQGNIKYINFIKLQAITTFKIMLLLMRKGCPKKLFPACEAAVEEQGSIQSLRPCLSQSNEWLQIYGRGIGGKWFVLQTCRNKVKFQRKSTGNPLLRLLSESKIRSFPS